MYATLQGVALTSELPGPWGDQVWFLSAHLSHHLPLTLPIFILLYSLPQPGGSKQGRGPGQRWGWQLEHKAAELSLSHKQKPLEIS